MDSSIGADLNFTSNAAFPNQVKLRKKLPVWFLEITLGVDHHLSLHTLRPVLTIKDKFLKGDFGINTASQKIEYTKSYGIPCIGRLSFNAGFNYKNPMGMPFVGFKWGNTSNSEVMDGNPVSFRQPIPVGRKVSLEVCGEVRHGGGLSAAVNNQHLHLGNGPLNLHLKEINAIINL